MKPVDVEGAVRFVLLAVCPDVATQVPSATIPGEFIRVRRMGGGRINLAEEQVLVLVECWGPEKNDPAAFNLAARAWAAIDAADGRVVSGMWVADTGLGSPVANPDPATGRPRYQFTATMTVALALA